MKFKRKLQKLLEKKIVRKHHHLKRTTKINLKKPLFALAAKAIPTIVQRNSAVLWVVAPHACLIDPFKIMAL
jgi:hypothetical protein